MHSAIRRAFSLVEVLVVLAVIGLLISLMLPAIQRVREASSRVGCINNLRQIGVALHHYHNDNGGLPPRVRGHPLRPIPNDRLGWMAMILPYIEQDSLYATAAEACRIDPEPTHNPPHTGFATVVRLYVCPTDSRLLSPLTDDFGYTGAFTSYIGITAALSEGAPYKLWRGVLPHSNLQEIRDGTSNTIMVGERPPPGTLQAGWWYPGFWFAGKPGGLRGPNNYITLGWLWAENPDPYATCALRGVCLGPGRVDNPCDRYHLWSFHPGGACFLFADGHARYLPYSADRVMRALASIDGGEQVDLTEFE